MRYSLLATCLLASNLFAGQTTTTMTTTKSEPPKKECAAIGYMAYGDLLYLQTNASNNYYAVQAIGVDPSSDVALSVYSPNWTSHEISPNYHLGFDVGAGMVFRDVKLNLILDWQRVHATDSDAFTVPDAPGNMVGPIFDIGPNSSFYSSTTGQIKSHFDLVNLRVGQQLNKNKFLNWHAGVSLARIKQSIYNTYANGAAIGRSISSYSKFLGAGPELGLNYDYKVFKNFFFSGNSSVSILMGQLQNNTTYQSFTPELVSIGAPVPNVQNVDIPNRAQVVPGFEQKIGLSYVASFDCCKLDLGIGYQCQIYLNAVQSMDMVSQVVPAILTATPDVGLYAVAFQRTLSNYMLSGLYATAGLEF